MEQSELLSGLVSVSARSTSKEQKGNLISEIEVKDLEKPIKLDIPLTEGISEVDSRGSVPRCMFLNEQTDKWEELSPSCGGDYAPKAGDTKITCCSTHLTTFSVQRLRYVGEPEQELAVTAVRKSNPDGPSEICSAHLHFVLFVNLFLLIFVVTGCCLDAKKKLVFKPSYKQDVEDISKN